MRYEKGFIILISNYNFDERDKIFKDNIVADSITGKVVGHTAIFYINVSSYRLKDKMIQLRSNN